MKLGLHCHVQLSLDEFTRYMHIDTYAYVCVEGAWKIYV